MKKLLSFILVLTGFMLAGSVNAQRKGQTQDAKPIDTKLFNNFKFRNIGPAFMSGRISDLAIDPTNENIWYVAVSSGGVWKTINAGTTFTPVFDDQSVFATGCVTIDPNNTHTIWVGTGENNGGRHISFGDGVYKSEDDGATWTNMGLKQSEHISKIYIKPGNSNVILVASQGPLWSAGGERGFYKSTDGGKNWKKTLGDEEWTGVTDFVVDPRDPNRIYAATWQHNRTVAAWMGGGEKTKIYASSDGGDTWEMLKSGLPEGKMGKIGLAISPQNPDVLYAAIETNRKTGGVWRSDNRGSSWTKMSDAVAGATGPHYYQELYASPHQFDKLYFMDSPLRMSLDGGKTFTEVNTTDKHVDNHAIAFKKDDPNYLMVGTDGGVYESFDLGDTWRYMENLPVTQFYKVALDDSEPFYNIYGGTQDNSSQGGSSRTDNITGITNADWQMVLNWDGHQPATEPGNPDIIYAERQEGNISRIDMKTGEVIDIQPQAGADEGYERFNWDAPILVSPHKPSTIFFASYRVWKSENRGDSWTAISGDLTKNQKRVDLPIMGKQQSWDSPWDLSAMSVYNTITSLAQSPKDANIIYAGTDDGLLQVTDNAGSSWKKINVSEMGVPATAFINDVKADLYDANTVYVSLDNHKYGDYKPYFVKSTDKGATWTSLTNGLGSKNLVWRFVQDHVQKELCFLGTEFGIYFTVDGGNSWTELNGGIPTISFRDLAIQKRENDLVGASFGRGFFILDDYSALREVSSSQLTQEATLFKPRKAWWYVPRATLDFDDKRGSLGSQLFVAPNPDFGAVFTYYLKDELKSDEKTRMDKEKGVSGNIPFPSWDALQSEMREEGPFVFLEIKDVNGTILNRVMASTNKGFNRVAWNLKVASPDVLTLDGGYGDSDALMVAPGTYQATLNKYVKGKITQLGEPVSVEVVPLREGSLKGSAPTEVAAFWRAYEQLSRDVSKTSIQLSNAYKTVDKLTWAASRSNVSQEVVSQVASVKAEVQSLQTIMNGNAAKLAIGERTNPTIGDRLFALNKGITLSTYGPTETHKQTMEIIKTQLKDLNAKLKATSDKISALAKQIVDAGGPWIEGQD
ncbi:glycosyl hydrolase [Fulvivirga sp.]|uniref:WD40/YVTN/BNR-like repeat-containing protein n=1 Tax=Fulvivirga sp. TaxID=1931237 RepID=UPI0032EC63A3